MRKVEKMVRELTKFLKKKMTPIHKGAREALQASCSHNNSFLDWVPAMSHFILSKLFTLIRLTFIIEGTVTTGQ